MAEKYIFEQYKETDRDDVLKLMQETFVSEKMRKANYFNSDFWRWQYQQNPSGGAITIVAKDNGGLIGQYANIPVHLKLNGEVLDSAIVIDLMVKESYRRRGLFKRMGEVSNSKLSELGIYLSLAFPSRYDSCAGFINKLGWFKVGDLRILVKPILPRIFNKKKGKGITIKKISDFPKEINNLWEHLKSEMPICIVRNREYLNWRYFKNPNGGYQVFLVYHNDELAGYFVLKIVNICKIKLGLIVDLLCLNELEIMKSIIFKIRELCLESGVHLCAILKTRLYEDNLKKLGFLTLPRRLSPKSYSLILRINRQVLDLATLKNIDNWYLTFGDWDVV